MDIASTKMTNIIATHVKSTASKNCQSKKVRDCYILHTGLSVVIFAIICYHRAKQKGIDAIIISNEK